MNTDKNKDRKAKSTGLWRFGHVLKGLRVSDFGLVLAALSRERSGSGFGLRICRSAALGSSVVSSAWLRLR
jgi:hypothetical protein